MEGKYLASYVAPLPLRVRSAIDKESKDRHAKIASIPWADTDTTLRLKVALNYVDNRSHKTRVYE